MKKSLKIILALAVAFSLLLTVACGTAKTADQPKEQSTKVEETKVVEEKKEVKISWLTSQAKYKDVFKDMAAELQKDEGYVIDFQVLPDDQFYTVVKTKLATSEVPDILEYNVPTTNEEIRASQNCEDLSNEPWVSRLSNPNLLKDYKDGKIYALPRESSSFYGAAYYNKKVMKELGMENPEPKTYKEFLDILEKIKVSGKDITPLYASNKDSWTTQIFMTLGFAVALSPNDKATWDNLLTNKVKWAEVPEFKDILTDYSDLYKKGYINKDHLSATYDMAKEAVATGKAAMMLNGEWAASDIVAKWPGTDLGAFIVPFKDKMQMGTGAYVQGLFVMKAGTQVEEVKKFLNAWSQSKYQNMFYAKLPGFPGFKDVDGGTIVPCVKELSDKYILTNKYTYQLNDPMGFASPIFADLWKYYIEMTVPGGKTPEQVLQAWDKKYSDYMKQKAQPGF